MESYFPVFISIAKNASTVEMGMKTSNRELLQAPLTAEEVRWASELADKLPDDVDLTFEESKILTRLSIRDWPDALILKVKDVIDVEDFLSEDSGQ
jgi:plasmid stability protein